MEKLRKFQDTRNDNRYNKAKDYNKGDQFTQWALCKWEGNPDLKMVCWKKTFGRGHASILTDGSIPLCYGANSDLSMTMRFPKEIDTIEKIQQALDIYMPIYISHRRGAMDAVKRKMHLT